MTRYSVQPRDRILVKGYGFFSFVRNMDKIVSKNLSSKYSQKLLNHAKQYNLKSTSTRAIQKTAEVTGDLIGKITADKISRI